MSKAKKKAYRFNSAQKAWLKALETGKRRQTSGVLYDGKGYCCLGIACRVLGIRADRDHCFDGAGTFAPESVVKALKLRSVEGHFADRHGSLTYLNDNENLSFKEIAAFIRANPEQVFV